MNIDRIIKKLELRESLFSTKGFNMRIVKKVFYYMRGPILEEASYFKPRYHITWGDFECNIKFNHGKHTDYLSFSANSLYAFPQMIAIGYLVNDKIHFVRERWPMTKGWVALIEADKKYYEDLKTEKVPECEEMPIRRGDNLSWENLQIIDGAIKAKKRIMRSMKKHSIFLGD